MGLRIAHAGPGRRCRRARLRGGDDRRRAGRSISCCRASRCRRRSPICRRSRRARRGRALSRSGFDRSTCRMDRRAERPLIITAAVGDAARGRGAGAARRALRHPGRRRIIRACRAAVEPSDAFRATIPRPLIGEADLIIVLECDAPWYPGIAAAAARLPRRAYRRGSGLSALSDAQLPERSCRSPRRRGTCCRRSTRRCEPVSTQAEDRRAPRANWPSAHKRAPRQGRRGGAARGERSRRRISAARSARRSATTRSSSTNIRCCLDHCPREKPGTFFGVSAGRRPRLGLRRRARRQARGARQARRRDRSATAPTCSPIRPSATGSATSSSCRC